MIVHGMAFAEKFMLVIVTDTEDLDEEYKYVKIGEGMLRLLVDKNEIENNWKCITRFYYNIRKSRG